MNYKRSVIACLSLFLFSLVLSQKQSALSKAIQNKYCQTSIADYIVIGVGTAGAAVTKMLTDDLQTSVIALHSGENLTQDPLIEFSANAPIVVASALVGSSFFQTGQTTPQIQADDRTVLWAIGLPEGGASSINAMAWVRQTNNSSAQWQAIAGPNWSVNRLLSIYEQLENYSGQTPDPQFRGFNGPIPVRQVAPPTLVSQKFTSAIINATGVPLVEDYNDPNTPIGASPQLQYTQTGTSGALRASSATIFLNNTVMTPDGFGVNGRKLRVIFDALALKTIWSGTKAIGVEYSINGQIQQLFASKGVIVCAGLQSSSFLMHSGIGPKALLNSLNIPVIADNPNVGQGLTDQPFVPLFFSTNPEDSSFPPLDPNTIFQQIAWLPDPSGDPTERAFHFATINIFPGSALSLFSLCKVRSQGIITINSADPTSAPIVNPGLFADSADLQLLQRGMQTYIKNINSALQAIDIDYELISPSPSILSNPNLVANFIKESVMTNQCWQGHCRMAPQNQGGVVDSTGRVYGVQNLIVADASIAPIALDATTMAPAYLIGANIAQLLLGT